jgi:3-hydroxyacyl-[acyl-carrier-protein] dehydratase
MTRQLATLENLDGAAIREVVPHRPPFLFLDRILTCVPGQFARSTWRIPEDAFFVAGHFPGRPIVPGVLLLEMAAQTACFAMASREMAEGIYLLVRVSEATFSRQVRPGEDVTTEAKLARQVEQFSIFSCESRSGEQRVAKAELLVALSKQGSS